MRKSKNGILYSATDIVNFLECEHIATLDLINLVTPLDKSEDDAQAHLIMEHGIRHEQKYLERLRSTAASVVEIQTKNVDVGDAAHATLAAMRSGANVIYQGALADGLFAGYSDFLVRVERPSQLGGFSYEVEDTKLSRSPKAKFLVQLCFYSSLLAKLQGAMPEHMHVVLGDGRRKSYRVADFMRYFETLQQRFMQRIADPAIKSEPQPCSKCGECSWSALCEKKWQADDHLSLVANIRADQIRKLNNAGVHTLKSLARLPVDSVIPKLSAESLAKVRSQAQLQLRARNTGKRFVEVLPVADGAIRGFARLPKPDPADLYFDMEGDPLEIDGLEYLFGIATAKGSDIDFKSFWAHSRIEEKIAFEAFMDFVTDHLRRHPQAHIYHYAAYEETALKRLMSLHGTREREVDDLLRGGKLVDLYKVVREGIRVSEPRYSIKNIEHFYMPAREGEVQNAGASIVFYERWRQTNDETVLKQIEDYNRDDVLSTRLLHEWLCKLRPPGAAWRELPQVETSADGGETSAELAQQSLDAYRLRLMADISEQTDDLSLEQQLRALTFQLLNFHSREQKPQWWALFNRMDADDDALIEDIDCVGGLVRQDDPPPRADKRSLIYTYRYPAQEKKLKSGDSCTIAATGESLGNVIFNPDTQLLEIRLGNKREAPPANLSLGPGRPVIDAKLRARVRKFADSVVAGDDRFGAVKDFLMKEKPRIAGQLPLRPIIDDQENLIDCVVKAVTNLQQSYLFIQGPPGAGKTYTGAHVIVALMERGFTVGVASNSHKAIHNLLEKVVEFAAAAKLEYHGFKKSSSKNGESEFTHANFDNSGKVADFDRKIHRLFAGTAWAFADLPSAEPLDYLFIDEAGQVSLANFVAMGISAKNIVLLGDQMQLGQPIQGVHPGHSGESTLDYLLDGRATIPANEGVFLPKTWRMHPAVCKFISDAVYEGRLQSADGLEKQRLVLGREAHRELRAVGVCFVGCNHEGCTQKSFEEASLVNDMYRSLLTQHYVDATGKMRKLKADDILVVSPYNMQVNLLKETLPTGARVGTVDKFQGQEGQVVLISMATSSGDDLPRDIEFLYSKNRLNVAISRARCLAVVIASPKLMSVRCSTPEQMSLINTLCWVQQWSLEGNGS